MKEINFEPEPEYEKNDLLISPLFEFNFEIESKVVYNNSDSDSDNSHLLCDYYLNPNQILEKGSEKIFKITKDQNKSSKNTQKSVLFKLRKIKKKSNDTINTIGQYFPFDRPRGIISLSNNQIYSVSSINDSKINFPFKFITKKYFISESGKKKVIQKKRKFKCDNIHKKIKSRFHKTLKNILNDNLKRAGSKLLFTFLPQCFIEKISKKDNSKYLNLTYKELLSKDFLPLGKQNNDFNYEHNKKVLKYLEENEVISKKSGFDLIKNFTYKELLYRYFNSNQFEHSIIQLINEKESPEYINEYINKAKNYLNFYNVENVNH